jgi:arginine/ornithine transport system ATP-binding protein
MTSNALKLQVDNIHKRFGSNEVLKGVSLTAHAGDVIAIIGSSGSGKSTFLRCINLLEKPNQGTIQVAGETMDLVPDPTVTYRHATPSNCSACAPSWPWCFSTSTSGPT